ncbi:DNA-3-methyladenine glycosylase I [Pediococcus siamensis]|uniref:DNA-3-methyladenine glycosylase I n=1 Tax=Pediococcus siamensis TaxID=381829 RepID=UPI0039A33D41
MPETLDDFICTWAKNGGPEIRAYHKNEWCQPAHDDQYIFEMMTLEIFQAGLNWELVLKKRPAFHNAFADFDVTKVEAMTSKDVTRLLNDSTIIRNRLKIQDTISNAQAFLAIQNEYGSFANYIWQFVNNRQVNNHIRIPAEIHAKTPLSEKIAKDLKKHGFKFMGPTITYSFMQAIGLVNDHEISCMDNPG